MAIQYILIDQGGGEAGDEGEQRGGTLAQHN